MHDYDRTKTATNAKLYYQLVDTLKELQKSGDDPSRVVQQALRQIKNKVYAADLYPPDDVITVESGARGDGTKSVIKLLKFLRWMGSAGTSRSIECEGKTITGFDGDGPDSIGAITLNGKTQETSKEEAEEFGELTR